MAEVQAIPMDRGGNARQIAVPHFDEEIDGIDIPDEQAILDDLQRMDERANVNAGIVQVNPELRNNPGGDAPPLVTLGTLFLETLAVPFGSVRQPAELGVQEQICQYLSLKDLKVLRRVNKFCNIMVTRSRGFCEKALCKISDRWHKDAQGTSKNGTVILGVPWRQFTMERFAYHRHMEIFKTYWTYSSKYLVELTMSKSSFECDGFAYILNECVSLRALNLSEVKLKHWNPKNTTVHTAPNVVAGNVMNTTANETIQRTNRMKLALHTLKCENIDFVNGCLFRYLSGRSGHLTSLELKNCGLSLLTGTLPGGPTRDQVLTSFENGIVGLIRSSERSFRKLGLENVVNQPRLMERLVAEFPDGLPITELSLGIREGESGNPNLANFMTTVARDVTVLNLEFLGPFTEDDLTSIVTPLAGTIRTLNLKLNASTMAADELLFQQPIFPRLTALQKLQINDVKPVSVRDLNAARGAKERRRDLRPTGERIQEARNSIRTFRQSNFLTTLPRSTRELSLKSVVFLDDFFTDIRNLQRVTGYQAFTKLEIQGPLLTPMDKGFELIPKNMPQLRTLILVDCDLSDSVVTGLGPSVCQEIRNSGTYTMGLLPEQGWTGGQDFAETMNNALMYNPQVELGVQNPPNANLNNNVQQQANPANDEPQDEDDEDDELPAANNANIGARPAPQAIPQLVHQMQGMPALPGVGQQGRGVPPAPIGNAQPPQTDIVPLPNNLNQLPLGGRPREIGKPRPHLYNLKELRHLDLSKNFEVTDVTLFDSLRNPELRELHLDECTRITDCGLDHISKHHPQLNVLSVKNCRRLTKYGLNQVVKGCPKLRRIFTTKIIAETDLDSFAFPMAPCYHDVVRYPTDEVPPGVL